MFRTFIFLRLLRIRNKFLKLFKESRAIFKTKCSIAVFTSLDMKILTLQYCDYPS